MKLGLTDLRDGAGFTQKDLGEKLNLDRKSITDLERKKRISEDTAIRYLSALEYEYEKTTISIIDDDKTGRTDNSYDWIECSNGTAFKISRKNLISFFTEYKDNIRTLRNIVGFKQQELADAAGIKQSSVALYESGKIKVSIANFRKIVDALGYDYSDPDNVYVLGTPLKKIMEDNVHKQKPENDAEIMWKKYKKLSLKAQRIVNELVDYLAEY